MSQPAPKNTTRTQLNPPELASHLVETAKVPWKQTKFPGIEVKVLFEDRSTGLLTALFRWKPGAVLPLHEHVDLEQTYVLEGTLEDDEGVVTAGNYIARPAGSRHIARAPEGALILAFFLRPNIFFNDDGSREVFDTGNKSRG